MGIRQDVFGLEQIYRLQIEGQWSTKEDVWLSPSPFGKISPFGYFTGGSQNNGSAVTRLDFSNDSAGVSVKGPLSIARGNHNGLSSSSHGYIVGGWQNPTYYTTVDRIDYTNDTATASPKGPLSLSRRGNSSSTNANFGYIGGGLFPSYLTTVERIDYSNDNTTASPKGPLSAATRYGVGATGNQSFGYFGGGGDPTVSTIDRIDYSNDTANASPKGLLSIAKQRFDATGNASFGYFAGGIDSSPFSTVDRIDYSNDTATAPAKGPLTSPGRYGLAATGNASSGYFCGGTPSGPLSKIDRIDYSNDTATATTIGNMPFTVLFGSAFSPTEQGNPNPTIFPASTVRENVAPHGFDTGYFGGGGTYGGSFYSTVDRVDYSNDTVAASAKGPLTSARYRHAAVGNASFGYFGGGKLIWTAPSVPLSTVDRIDYGNDTATAVAKGPLISANFLITATGNQNFGYFGGGYTPGGPTSRIQRIDYNNDTATASPKGGLNTARYGLAATGNTSFGYFMGGEPGEKSTVDRIDYSNDTANLSPKGNLSTGRARFGATGNASFAYSGGGNPGPSPISSVDRFDYSNDIATAVVKGPLSSARHGIHATGNSSFGYFGGGYHAGPQISTVDRVDYSNDTAAAAVKGPLSQTRNQSAATSSRENAMPLKGPGILEVPVSFADGTYATPNTGYFAGGYAPTYSSSVDRIDYANDDAAPVTKGPLVNPIADNAAGLSSKDYGYFAGGRPGPSVSEISSIQRIDYLNDTATALVRGNMTATSKEFSGTNTSNFGYLFKGSLPTVERLDYSNDTATTLAKAPLPNNVNLNQTAGNQSFGYGLGHKPGSGSKVSRIDYSNDTATALERGLLATEMGEATASGNAEFGYVFGGIYGGSRLSTTQRVDYANDTATGVTKGPMTVVRQSLASTGDTSFGYMSGGKPGPLSTVDRIDYSNDTATASLKGPLSAARYLHARASARSDALSVIGPSVVSNAAAMSVPNPTKVGYFIGGRRSPGQSGTTDVERIDYSNDTATAVVKGSLSITLLRAAATANNFFGYVGGGSIPGSPYITSTVQRIQFTNDTVTALERGQLTVAKSALSATGNSNFGYFGAGNEGAPNYSASRVDRIDYSNDTATAVEKGSLTLNRNSGTATGNQSFGYFSGGFAESPNFAKTSTVDRIDYGNDTATASPKGPLTSIRYNNAATGNSDFGYFGGGSAGLSFPVSTVDRIDYSNDTATASPKGPLSRDYGTSNLAATGNADFGYFGGGYVWPFNSSIVDRIDYSNDTATASLRGPLVYTRQLATACSGAANALPQ